MRNILSMGFCNWKTCFFKWCWASVSLPTIFNKLSMLLSFCSWLKVLTNLSRCFRYSLTFLSSPFWISLTQKLSLSAVGQSNELIVNFIRYSLASIFHCFCLSSNNLISRFILSTAALWCNGISQAGVFKVILTPNLAGT